jgi:serine/threonine protein phosphatase PrpC
MRHAPHAYSLNDRNLHCTVDQDYGCPRPRLRAHREPSRISMRVDAGARTDLGRVRANNEDSYGVFKESGLFIISDGMGGHADGEVASRMTVEAVSSMCIHNAVTVQARSSEDLNGCASDKVARLTQAAEWANRKIHLAGKDEPAQGHMGATLVAAWFNAPWLSIVNVGDSRAYLLRDGSLRQLTTDHSLVADKVQRGLMTPEEAESSESQSVLLRTLGVHESVQVDSVELLLEAGDTVLLCTDGLTRMVSHSEITATLQNGESAQAVADRLVSLANHYGGEDNVTVVVFRLESGAGVFDRLLGRFRFSARRLSPEGGN